MVEKLAPTALDQTISRSPGSGQSVHKARRLARLGQNPSGQRKRRIENRVSLPLAFLLRSSECGPREP